MRKNAKTSALSDTQLVILSAAAARDDRLVLPLPASLKTTGGALKRVLGALLKGGLIVEQRAGRDDEVWRTDENDRRLTLAITPAGLAAIGLDGADANATAPALTVAKGRARGSGKVPNPLKAPGNAGNRRSKPRSSGKPDKQGLPRRASKGSPGKARQQDKASRLIRPETKTATVTSMLRSPDGASIEEMTEATGWQAHSVRGFLSGMLKKKLGLTVTSEKRDGVRRYRIPT